MRLIFDIASAEIKHFLNSAVAWFMVILFTMITALMFLGKLEDLSIYQDSQVELQGAQYEGFLGSSLSSEVLMQPTSDLLLFFFVFIPLLTMSVINRESNGGTIRLLNSSPIRIRQIVLGKFLGAYSIVVFMIAAMMVSLLVVNFSIVAAEWSRSLSIVLGFLLTGALYVAIGVFISSITQYTILAAMVTLVALGVISTSHNFLQGYDYIRDLTFNLSSNSRANRIIQGLLTTRDIIYFICMIALFLLFTIFRIKSLTESKSWRIAAGRYLIAFSCTLVVLLVTSIQSWIGYWDVTRGKTNTIHPKTVAMLHQLDGSPLKITVYNNLLGKNTKHGLPTRINPYKWDFLNQYVRFYPNIEFEFVNYYDRVGNDSSLYKLFPGKTIEEIAERYADIHKTSLAVFKTPQEIRNKVDLSEERGMLIMELEYRGKKAFLRTYENSSNPPWPGQMQVSGTIARLLNDTMPTFQFLSGHHERSPKKMGEREYGGHAVNKASERALINLGIDVDTASGINFRTMSKKDVLVIADPKTELSPDIIEGVKEYLDNGGNAIFYTEPGKQFILNPILNHVGVHSKKGTLVQVNSHDLPNKFLTNAGPSMMDLADEPILYGIKQQVYKTGLVGIKGASVLQFKDTLGFQVAPILPIAAQKSIWEENGTLVIDSAAPLLNLTEGDLQQDEPYIVGVKLARTINNKEQRILVVSDADIMSAAGGDGGSTIMNAFYSYTVNNELPVYTNYPIPTDYWLSIKKGTAKTLKKVVNYGIPIFLLILCIVVLIRRKRK